MNKFLLILLLTSISFSPLSAQTFSSIITFPRAEGGSTSHTTNTAGPASASFTTGGGGFMDATGLLAPQSLSLNLVVNNPAGISVDGRFHAETADTLTISSPGHSVSDSGTITFRVYVNSTASVTATGQNVSTVDSQLGFNIFTANESYSLSEHADSGLTTTFPDTPYVDFTSPFGFDSAASFSLSATIQNNAQALAGPASGTTAGSVGISWGGVVAITDVNGAIENYTILGSSGQNFGFSAIPEPSTDAAVIGLGALAWAARRRLRSKSSRLNRRSTGV